VEPNIPTLIGALILAGILWIAKSVSELGKTLAILKTVLLGSDGRAGLDGEVQSVRKRLHEQGDIMHTLAGNHDLLKQRVDSIERRQHIRRAEDRAEVDEL
jgi:hypothetical protein